MPFLSLILNLCYATVNYPLLHWCLSSSPCPLLLPLLSSILHALYCFLFIKSSLISFQILSIIIPTEKSTYHTLNLFKNDVAGNLLRGRGWVLTESVSKARSALKRAHISLNLPPTVIFTVMVPYVHSYFHPQYLTTSRIRIDSNMYFSFI